jgi:hypothetical protein
VQEGCRALSYRVAGAGSLRSGDMGLGDGGGTRMNSRLLVVEAHGRVAPDDSVVGEGRWVTEEEVRNDGDFRSRMRGLGHLGDFGACGSKDRQSGVDCWVCAGDSKACGRRSGESKRSGAVRSA